MFLAKIVFAVFTCVTLTNYVFVASQDDVPAENEEEQPEDESTPAPPENHTFVALIDIVFTDGRRRSCTGTIIHDNVVITAAHCFVDHNVYIEVELTASFVVIGTKKMYDTGYENYLPIERVVTHPKYRGWTADLALVYTFAGMTSDKPGNIIPLVGETTLMPVDSNVTILSWGHCKDEVPPSHTRAPAVTAEKRLCQSSEDVDDDSCERTTIKYLREGFSSTEPESSDQEPSPKRYGRQGREIMQTRAMAMKQGTTPVNYKDRASKAQRFVQYRIPGRHEETSAPASRSAKVSSRYLASSEAKERNKERGKAREKDAGFTPQRHRYHKTFRNSSNEDQNIMIVDPMRRKQKLVVKQESGRKSFMNKEGDLIVKSGKEKTKPKENEFQTYFKNWRRQLGSQQNKLTVEVFGFVNVQTCKKLIDKALPAIYSINTNDVVCYAAEEHYISDDDSGAPAIRQGQLVAVTLGGAECEGDHVAVGIKMSCFCSWIAENLPSGGKDIKCCKNCCNGKNNQEYLPRHRYRSKYL